MSKPKPVKVSKVDPSIIARTAGAAKDVSAATGDKAVGVRGPKGVALTAAITLLVATNPKRPTSKAFERFAGYQDGMTVQAALDTGLITPDLVYDAAHGFIAIEGYAPELIVRKEKAVKEPKAPRTAKGGKVKAEPNPDAEAAAADMKAQTKEEMID